MKHDFYRIMQKYIAVTTIGPSTLRNQGAKGVIKAATDYLGAVKLSTFSVRSEEVFLHKLDAHTERLRMAFPPAARNWGAARKALNLFLRDVCYNRFLCKRHSLAQAEDWMEVPLDGLVAKALKRETEKTPLLGEELPAWPGLNALTAEVSRHFQCFARKFAGKEGVSRIHLDMILWLRETAK